MANNKKIIGVIGTSSPSQEETKLAYELGGLIAEKGAILICGGLGGIMESVCKGTKEKGGITIGILPEDSKIHANKYVDIPIPTGFSHARNIIIVRTSDSIISIGGGYGTLSEIAFALKLNIPVFGLGTWEIKDPNGKLAPIKIVKTPQEALELALQPKIETFPMDDVR